jgi:hypothetical protein
MLGVNLGEVKILHAHAAAREGSGFASFVVRSRTHSFIWTLSAAGVDLVSRARKSP